MLVEQPPVAVDVGKVQEVAAALVEADEEELRVEPDPQDVAEGEPCASAKPEEMP